MTQDEAQAQLPGWVVRPLVDGGLVHFTAYSPTFAQDGVLVQSTVSFEQLVERAQLLQLVVQAGAVAGSRRGVSADTAAPTPAVASPSSPQPPTSPTKRKEPPPALLDPTEVGPPERTDETAKRARLKGYTGDVCAACGGANMRRNGSGCLFCETCGESTGCS